MNKSLLQKYKIRPSKRLGQNFLIDKKTLRKIIEAAELKPDDVVLEVGPGLGILTLELAKRVKKVIAVEKDRKMIRVLKEILRENKIQNVEVVEGDIRKYPITNDQYPNRFLCHPEWRPVGLAATKDLISEKDSSPSAQNDKMVRYKLIANIPYYLTSPLIRKFLESENPPQLIVLMIQKEVAQRICAHPPKMTLLSIAVQFYAEPKIISYISKKSFWPQPKVDSAIIKIIPKATPIRGLHPDDTDKFFKIVKAGFTHPRKQLINNLSAGLKIDRQKLTKILRKSNIKPTQRPSELSVDMWISLCGEIVDKGL